jgi:hypothetical protein
MNKALISIPLEVVSDTKFSSSDLNSAHTYLLQCSIFFKEEKKHGSFGCKVLPSQRGLFHGGPTKTR